MSLWTNSLQLLERPMLIAHEPLRRDLLKMLAFIALLSMCQGVGALDDEDHLP